MAPAPGAFEAALAALRRRERTTAELRSLLERRGYGPSEVEAAIARLVDAGELDDARFASAYAEDKRELRGWGAERIREALSARGVPQAAVEQAIAGDAAPVQVERARRLIAARGRSLDSDPARARALGFLTRRGYDYEIAYEAVRAAERAERGR